MNYYPFANRIRVATPTIGTGTLSLGAPLTGMQPFDGNFTSGAQLQYTIEDPPTHWEVGYGTYTKGTGTTPSTLSRDIVESSTNGNALISLSGSATVFVTPVASWLEALQTMTASAAVGDSPPAGVVGSGALWWDSKGGQLYTFYIDPSGPPGQWVPATSAGAIAGAYLPLTGVPPLPTTKPSIAGVVWINGGVLCVS